MVDRDRLAAAFEEGLVFDQLPEHRRMRTRAFPANLRRGDLIDLIPRNWTVKIGVFRFSFLVGRGAESG